MFAPSHAIRPSADPDIDDAASSALRAAQRRFDQSMSRVRQIERSFALENRQSDRNSRQALGRTADAIASLHREMLQLGHQRSVLQRKLGGVRQVMAEARDRGLSGTTAPLRRAFQSFQTELDRAIENIDIIFANFNSRVQDCLLMYTGVDRLSETVARLQSQMDDLQRRYMRTAAEMGNVRAEIHDQMVVSRENLILRFKSRIENVSMQLAAFEEKAARAVAQSDSAITEAQDCEVHFRQECTKALSDEMTVFTKRFQALRSSIMELRKTRMEQIEAIRARLTSWGDEKRKSQNQAVQKPRLSLQPEIRQLKRELHALKRRLRQTTQK
jgi:phage host-nuclease inhibitor protein Gam